MAVYGDRSNDRVNQGDIFAGVPVPVPLPDTLATVMVISHDCELDKFLDPARPLAESVRAEWRVTVAVVHAIDALGGDRPRAVREDAMTRYFHLPAEEDLPESAVDFWTEQPVRMTEILECERTASLSPEWREKMWWKLIRLRLGKNYRAILAGNVPADEA